MLLPREFKTYLCITSEIIWQCAHRDLDWHCNPKKGIYREAINGDTKEEAESLMLKYLIDNKLIK